MCVRLPIVRDPGEIKSTRK